MSNDAIFWGAMFLLAVAVAVVQDMQGDRYMAERDECVAAFMRNSGH